jgi:hypothetical protein
MDKRFYRNLKKDIKKEGNRDRRNHFKRQLRDDPEDTDNYYEFKQNSSEKFNGMFRDNTRIHPDEEGMDYHDEDDRF